MKRLSLLVGLLVCLLSGVLSAHQDTPLKLEDGKIIGLPDKYQPASFDRKKKILTIAGKSLAFPAILHALFIDDRVDELFGDPLPVKGHAYKLKLSASWYHSELDPELPPYMLIRIEPDDRDYAFELLIDMDRLRFIRADAQIATIGAIPIDLDGIIDSLPNDKGEQRGADQPATAAESKAESKQKPKPESEGRSQ
ncbi:MAG: hypothetical protein ABGY95_01130 [Rubritalea sp.]|uniref:hypothetical protein n=1 Tax=Rubritalea sp. TaxID=2109375 RepID=UPI003242FDE7